MFKYDIIVVGGGFSGSAAALAAARQGKKVLLAEKTNALGGASNINLVSPYMTYYTGINGSRYYLSKGIFAEINSELRKLGGFMNPDDVHYFDEELLKLVLNRMLTSAGVDILFHAFLCSVSRDGRKIGSVTFATKSGNLDFTADAYIDATGDATLAKEAGCSYRLGRDSDSLCQPMTLCFRVGGIDTEQFFREKDKANRIYMELKAQGKIRNERENILCFYNNVPGVVHFNTTRVCRLNPVDAFDVSKAEIEAREQVFELVALLKENLPSCRNAHVSSTALEIGVRESRMINGEYLLNETDLKNCTKFKDSIALGNYDIDIHSPDGAGTSHYYFKEGEYYTIPYRCLVPKDTDNLLVTGRCISVTHEAQASIRIMPIVCCLGEAAGVAAAVALNDNVAMKDADTDRIRSYLELDQDITG